MPQPIQMTRVDLVQMYVTITHFRKRLPSGRLESDGFHQNPSSSTSPSLSDYSERRRLSPAYTDVGYFKKVLMHGCRRAARFGFVLYQVIPKDKDRQHLAVLII